MSAPTATQLVDRVRAALPASSREHTVDTFLDGDPASPVGRVVVTTMATLAVLRGVVGQDTAEGAPAAGAGHATGATLVVTHEPLYFDHENRAVDRLEAESDPVHAAKRAFVAEHGLVVWHLHDLWHDQRPDGIDAGAAAALGWTLDPDEAAAGLALADVGETTLGDLARHVADRLGARALRYVGDPGSPVRRVGLDLGFRGAARNQALLRRPDVDVAVVGEAHEWETGEYAVDAVAAGVAAGLVVVGHVPSEQAGMAAAAGWLRDLLPDVPVDWLETPDPFTAL